MVHNIACIWQFVLKTNHTAYFSVDCCSHRHNIETVVNSIPDFLATLLTELTDTLPASPAQPLVYTHYLKSWTQQQSHSHLKLTFKSSWAVYQQCSNIQLDRQWATSLFGLVFHHFFIVGMNFSAMLTQVQNCKYKVNILRVKWKSTIQVFSVAILAPVFAQLIQTSDWDQNSGVRLVFGLSERLIQ